MSSQNGSVCNCPSIEDVQRGVIQSKPPCPIHDTPENLARMGSLMKQIPVQVGGVTVASIPQSVLDGKGDGTPHPKADPDHKHNYLKRTEAARTAADAANVMGATNKIAAAFGYEDSFTMARAIEENKKKAGCGG